jgi:hypothetical protein
MNADRGLLMELFKTTIYAGFSLDPYYCRAFYRLYDFRKIVYSKQLCPSRSPYIKRVKKIASR